MKNKKIEMTNEEIDLEARFRIPDMNEASHKDPSKYVHWARIDKVEGKKAIGYKEASKKDTKSYVAIDGSTSSEDGRVKRGDLVLMENSKDFRRDKQKYNELKIRRRERSSVEELKSHAKGIKSKIFDDSETKRTIEEEKKFI